MFKKKWQLTLTIAFLSLGLLLSMQFKTNKAYEKDLNSQSNDTLAAIAKDLNTKQSRLVQEVWDLRTQLRLLEQSTNEENLALEAMRRELEKLHIAIGSRPVEGPGIIITVPEHEHNFIGAQDIADIVNELWNAGAEAVAVNGIRVNHKTSFLPANEISTVYLNEQAIKLPFKIEAIGEPTALDKGISIQNGIIDHLKNIYKIPIEIKHTEKLKLPGTTVSDFKYAVPTKEQPLIKSVH